MNKENILLLFLSDVKVRNGIVSVATYSNISADEEKRKTETTNESAVRYLSQIENAPPNKIFYFASTKVQGNIDGKEISHVDYFKNRIKEDVASNDVEEVMVPCNFDEDADVEKTMDTVVDMATKIQEYIDTLQKDDKITLHVDMTGGMRHASLMMLVITRLIQYSGVKIGNILYSNFHRGIVEKSNEIYKLFDVISGAYEFVSFGSVDAIKKYFEEKNPQGELKNLLDAMERFSNAIKICQTSIIESELKNLNTHIENFKNVGSKQLHENLFANLIDTIKKEYGILLSESVTRIDIIRWCMNKGFWQQVLTLCTEWIPEMIVDYGIYCTDNDKTKFYSKIRGEKYRNWKQNLVISYLHKDNEDKNFENDVMRTFFDAIRILSNHLMDEKVTFSTVIEQLKNFGKLSIFFREYEQFLKDYPDCKTIRKFIDKRYAKSVVNAFTNEFPTLKEVLQKIFDIHNSNKHYNKKFPEFLDTVPRYNLLKYLFDTKDENNRFQFSFEQLMNIFNLEFNDNFFKFVIAADLFQKDNKWDKRKEEYLTMLNNRILFTHLNNSDSIQILEDYYEIRAKRNDINHANGKASEEINNLKTIVETCLKKLERYKK